MTGLPIVLGNHRSPHSTYMQAAGKGQCIPAAELRISAGEHKSILLHARDIVAGEMAGR